VQAQREYARRLARATASWIRAEAHEHAWEKRDGLYWESQPGEEASPFGPLLAKAHAEGYGQQGEAASGAADAGAVQRLFTEGILTRQGRRAPGAGTTHHQRPHGRRLALLACPEVWGNSGVMTFMVNQQGKVYQKKPGREDGQVGEGDHGVQTLTKTWEPVK